MTQVIVEMTAEEAKPVLERFFNDPRVKAELVKKLDEACTDGMKIALKAAREVIGVMKAMEKPDLDFILAALDKFESIVINGEEGEAKR